MNEKAIPDLDEIQKLTTEKIKKAAVERQPDILIEALFEGQVLDGMKRRLHRRWPSVPGPEIDYVVSEAVGVLYQDMSGGTKILNPLGYVWRVAFRRASDYYQMRSRERLVNIEILDQRAAPEPQDFEENEETVYERRRVEAKKQVVELARGLLPRLGQANVQAVVGFYIDTVAAGRLEITNFEIGEALGLSGDTVRTSLSRGLRRLRRLAREDGIEFRDLVPAETENNLELELSEE
jgi:DNA-directed RNA polymerase specialized sigma24 family protein